MSDRTRGDSSNNSLRILASLVIALCIWLFSAFNDDYDHAIHAKLSYVFPSDVEVDGSLPDQVILQLRGNGWTLLRASAYHPQVKVDWQEIKDRTVIDLQKYKAVLSAEIPGNAEVVDIYPGFVPVKYSEIDSVKLPVQPDVRWRADKHSTDVIKLKPDSVWVKGEGSALAELAYWPTEKLYLSGLDTSGTIPLAESKGLRLSAVAVQFSFKAAAKEHNKD